MARFLGTKEEFNKFLGGYCRNKVQQITKQEKEKRKGVCMFCCRNVNSLDAAHQHHNERSNLVLDILNQNFKVSENQYDVDINKFETIFIDRHKPIEDNFYFLCRDCHTKYDNNMITDEQILEAEIERLQKILKNIK